MSTLLSSIPVGQTVLIEWSREPVQVVYQSSSWTTVKPLHSGEKRDISTACEVLPYDGREHQHREQKPKPVVTEVTFKDFRNLMLKRKRTVDDLVDIFHGQLDENRSFFDRVFSCQWRNPDTGRFEDRSDVVIPYRSVLKFYFEELHYLEDSKKKRVVIAEPGKPTCACGCGEAIFGRKRWARPGCKKRLQREMSVMTIN